MVGSKSLIQFRRATVRRYRRCGVRRCDCGRRRVERSAMAGRLIETQADRARLSRVTIDENLVGGSSDCREGGFAGKRSCIEVLVVIARDQA